MSSPTPSPRSNRFACLYGESPHLEALAKQFSPWVEMLDPATVVFSIDGLERLIGTTQQIASEISRLGAQMGIAANLAIASNPTTAALAARNLPGVTLILPGQEAERLAALPIDVLPAEPTMLTTLERWGIHTLGDLAALPETGVLERLGRQGQLLRRHALGHHEPVLTIEPAAADYRARHELDDPVKLLEPIFFIVSRQLRDLTERLKHNGQAAGGITLVFDLDDGSRFNREIELPIAMRDPMALLKQVQLSLEAHPPTAAILCVELALQPAAPRVVQGGLFLPPTPEPERLQTLIARLQALAGRDRVGSPEVLDTFRPDAFRLRPIARESAPPSDPLPSGIRLGIRYFRPPAAARVSMANGSLQLIGSDPVNGAVVHSAGPWRRSGEWWADTAWDRDEWDITLDDRSMHRIFRAARRWFVQGTYD